MNELPEGHRSLDDALKELKRDDIRDAFDQMFNDFLAKDDAFRAFATNERKYAGVLNPAFKLSEKSSSRDRELVAHSIQAFLNFSAKRGDYQWFAKLRNDISTVQRDILKLARDTVDENGVADLRTMLLVSAYTWRRRNQSTSISSWTKKAGVEIKDGTARPKEREVKRDRVLQFPY